MGKYTDEEIRAMPKITLKIAADYLGISPPLHWISGNMQQFPICQTDKTGALQNAPNKKTHQLAPKGVG